jgi:hypothetical protein
MELTRRGSPHPHDKTSTKKIEHMPPVQVCHEIIQMLHPKETVRLANTSQISAQIKCNSKTGSHAMMQTVSCSASKRTCDGSKKQLTPWLSNAMLENHSTSTVQLQYSNHTSVVGSRVQFPTAAGRTAQSQCSSQYKGCVQEDSIPHFSNSHSQCSQVNRGAATAGCTCTLRPYQPASFPTFSTFPSQVCRQSYPPNTSARATYPKGTLLSQASPAPPLAGQCIAHRCIRYDWFCSVHGCEQGSIQKRNATLPHFY